MQLALPIPPEAVQQAADAGIHRFLSPGDRRLAVLSGSGEAERWAQRVFLLGIKPVIGGVPLESAAMAVGWRFLARENAGEFAASFVTEPSPRGRPRLASVSHGRRLRPYFEAAERIGAVAQSQPQAGRYQLRALTIPCLLIEAFWLVPEAVVGGLIVPFVSMVPEFQAMPVLTVDRFLEICKPLAVERQAADDHLRPGVEQSYGWPPE